jgi:hypothetical protein
VSIVCCQVEVSVPGLSLVQRSSTECCLSEFDCEASTKKRPWPTGAVAPMGEKIVELLFSALAARCGEQNVATK